MTNRNRLPTRRPSWNFTIEFQGERYNVTMGHYSAGIPGEVFINRIFGANSAKIGTMLDDVCRDSAILVSFALQYGANFDTIASALTRNEFDEPATIVGAVFDYVSKHGNPWEPLRVEASGVRGKGSEQ